MKRPEIKLRAIHANAGIEAWYRKVLQDLIKQMADSMLRHARAAYRADPDIGFAKDEDPVVTLRRSLNRWGSKWRVKLNRASNDIADRFATQNTKNIDAVFAATLREAGFTVRFKPTEGMKQAYRAVAAEQVNLIRSIAPQFLKDVQSQVWQSVMRGGTLSELSKGIKQKYGVTWRRAALIARDQNNKAKAIMEEQRRKELGVRFATWQHSHAGKQPRPTHVAMHGKRYDISKGMYDSAIGKNVWPGTEINCRCTSRAIIPALE